ncbi:MAG TPA: hypothetical protein VD864_06935, partial [Nocardioides sp.]|nr:hypothetical protein [Nocardioides sp.]
MSYTRKQAIEELAIQLARVIDDLDLGVAENVLTEAVAERGWHIRTRLEFSDHPDDREPYVVTTLTIRRDETPTEREARYARQAARAAIAEWAMDPESGPPPEGVGFRDMLDQDTWWRPRDE